MTATEFIQQTPVDALGIRGTAKCLDGACFSIQNGQIHHADDHSVEVACLPDEHLAEVGADDGGFRGRPHKVYGYVPISNLEEVIAAHGGIVGTASHDEMWEKGWTK